MVRKGQAAMEFLMTYGWAILVVLAAIGALAFFGVLSPDKFLPSKCTIQSGFSCTEFKVESATNNVRLRIQNNLGQDTANATVTLAGRGANSGCAPAAQSFLNTTTNGDALGGGLLTFSCGSLSGSKFQGDITIVYVISGQVLSHTSTGSIVASVE